MEIKSFVRRYKTNNQICLSIFLITWAALLVVSPTLSILWFITGWIPLLIFNSYLDEKNSDRMLECLKVLHWKINPHATILTAKLNDGRMVNIHRSPFVYDDEVEIRIYDRTYSKERCIYRNWIKHQAINDYFKELFV